MCLHLCLLHFQDQVDEAVDQFILSVWSVQGGDVLILSDGDAEIFGDSAGESVSEGAVSSA